MMRINEKREGEIERTVIKNPMDCYLKNLLIAGSILCCMFIFFVTETPGQEDKPAIAVWKFEEAGPQISDSAGNGNNGKPVNENNVKRVQGRNGKALKFALENRKNGCVIITGIAEKYGFFTKGITVEAWIKINSSFKRESTYEIVSNTESDRGRGFRLIISWGKLCLRSGEGGSGGKTWEASSNTSAQQIKPDIWYHAAGVYDGSVFKVYLDGDLVGQSEEKLALTPGKKDLCIGSYGNGSAYGFDGVIDEVKIYDYPRTDLQILQDAKSDQ